MKAVKFLHTSAGVYGVAHAGDVLTLKDRLAEQLEKQGNVEIVGDAGEESTESIPEKGSVRFIDQTNQAKQQEAPAQETDEKNPTKEKNQKAGPNDPKKK